jgi:hypothetical protein
MHIANNHEQCMWAEKLCSIFFSSTLEHGTSVMIFAVQFAEGLVKLSA